jgi:TPR repeat protein
MLPDSEVHRLNEVRAEASRLLADRQYGLARDRFESSYDGRDPDVANSLGYIYSLKEFSDYNLAKSVEYYTTAASQGNTYAQHALAGICKEMGDINKAIFWCTKASESGSGDCSYILYRHHLEAGDNQAAKMFLERAVQQGHALATQRFAIRNIFGAYGWNRIPFGVRLYFSNIPKLTEYTKQQVR